MTTLSTLSVEDTWVEPCPDCGGGDHDLCDGQTLDHARDEFVPCPCRVTGHRP